MTPDEILKAFDNIRAWQRGGLCALLAGACLLCAGVSVSGENRMTRPDNLLVTDWTQSHELYGQPHAIWLDAVGDVQPGLPPTDHPPAEVAGVIHRLRYIKPPDDCDGALNCPPGASKHAINVDTARRQPASVPEAIQDVAAKLWN